MEVPRLEVMVFAAKLLMQDKRYQDAVTVLKGAQGLNKFNYNTEADKMISEDLGTCYLYLGCKEEALENFQKCHTLSEALYGAEDEKTIKSLTYVGFALHKLDRGREALSYYERAEAFSRTFLGPEHKVTADCMEWMGMVNITLRQYARALSFYKKAKPLYEKIYGPNGAMTKQCSSAIEACRTALKQKRK